MERKFLPYKNKILKRIVNDPDERELSILDNLPVRFEIRKNDKINIEQNEEYKKYHRSELGNKAVRDNYEHISKYAKKHNLDPNITRSVMYAENARGHKGGLNQIADWVNLSESPLPMNIQKNRWAKLLDKKPDDLYDPDANIETGTILLKRIADRIDKPDASKIGSIWNYIGREQTNEFGEYIGKVYRERPWEQFE